MAGENNFPFQNDHCDHWWQRQEYSISELMKASWHIILQTLTFISCPPADCSKMTIILCMCVCTCLNVCLFGCVCLSVCLHAQASVYVMCMCVYAYCLCMREQSSLFIKMSPVMAAKLTMCFREQSWPDKSLCGRRCVWSTPIHLYYDLPLLGDPPLTEALKHCLASHWVTWQKWL